MSNAHHIRHPYRQLLCTVILLLVGACGEATPTPTPSPTAAPAMTTSPVPLPDMPEMEVDSVRTDSSGPIVLLREKGSARYLAIGIGPLEATAIAVKLRQISVERPLTQDLLTSMIFDLGGRVQHVIITDLIANVFYAKIVLNQNGNTLRVDSRPSDAIALALRAQVPVYASESVLEKASFALGRMD